MRDIQHAFDPNLGRTKPLFRMDGAVLSRNDYHLSVLDRVMDVSRLVWLTSSKGALLFSRPDTPTRSGVHVVIACLDAIRTLANDRGARVHILAHRRLVGPSRIDDVQWSELLDRSGAVDISDVIRARPGPTPVSFDGIHWSAEGHRRVGALLRVRLTTFNRNTDIRHAEQT